MNAFIFIYHLGSEWNFNQLNRYRRNQLNLRLVLQLVIHVALESIRQFSPRSFVSINQMKVGIFQVFQICIEMYRTRRYIRLPPP